MTTDEIVSLMTGTVVDTAQVATQQVPDTRLGNLPLAVDWRDKVRWGDTGTELGRDTVLYCTVLYCAGIRHPRQEPEALRLLLGLQRRGLHGGRALQGHGQAGVPQRAEPGGLLGEGGRL